MLKRRTLLQIAAIAALPLSPRAARADDPAPAWERVVARVGRNHAHVFEVSAADVRAAVEKRYDLVGTAGHPHAVTLTADHFAKLAGGEIVRLPSSREGGHIHRLLVRCAPAIDPPETQGVCDVEIAGKDDHELVVTAADIGARAERSYHIQGIAGHDHAVLITAAQFEKLVRGDQLVLRSGEGDQHTHNVYVRYPTKKPGP